MDMLGLAGAWVGAKVGEVQMAAAADLLQTDASRNQASVSKLIDAAEKSANALANVAAGLGTSLDTSA